MQPQTSIPAPWYQNKSYLLGFIRQLMYNLDSALELGLLLFIRFNRAIPTVAALGTAVAPLEVVTAPSDASIEAVNILTAWRVLCGKRREDGVELTDELSCV